MLGWRVAVPFEHVAPEPAVGARAEHQGQHVRPLLDLDVSTYLVQNIKLAEVHAIGTNDRVRMPRQPLAGEHRAAVEKIVTDALATRPKLPEF